MSGFLIACKNTDSHSLFTTNLKIQKWSRETNVNLTMKSEHLHKLFQKYSFCLTFMMFSATINLL